MFGISGSAPPQPPRSASPISPTTCSAWPGSTGELRPPDRNRAGRRQIFAPPVQNSAPETAQLTPINAPTPASHPISSPKRQKPTVLRGVHVANSIATLRKRLSVALARTLFRCPCCQTISRRRNILRNSWRSRTNRLSRTQNEGRHEASPLSWATFRSLMRRCCKMVYNCGNRSQHSVTILPCEGGYIKRETAPPCLFPPSHNRPGGIVDHVIRRYLPG